MQLWVRIFPDECLVDTFEATLTESEIKNATIFWREYFHAAGVESAERAAWRGLVARHGSGPRDLDHPPVPAAESAEPRRSGWRRDARDQAAIHRRGRGAVSIASARAPLTQRRAHRARDLLGGDVDRRKPARPKQPRSTRSPVRSARRAPMSCARRCVPTISRRRRRRASPAPPRLRASCSCSCRSADDTDSRARSWSKAATASLLPERFVLLGYQGAAEVLNELGEPVQTPLHVSPDPRTDAESQFQFDADGNLTLGDELRWMVDFDEAVRRGMGFRVTLTPEQSRGFDRLFVLGVRLSADAARGTTDLQTLFLNHHFGKSGFTLLPQGSPTNNTEESSSAYSRTDDPDASFDFVFKNKARFDETDDWLDKRDGQWLAEALGLDTEWLKQIPNAGARRSVRGACDEHGAVARDAGLLHGHAAQARVRRRRAVLHALVLQSLRQRPRPDSRRAHRPAAVRHPAHDGVQPRALDRRRVARAALRLRREISRAAAERRSRPGCGSSRPCSTRCVCKWAQLAQGVAHVDAQDADPHQTLLDIVGLHPGLRGVPPALREHARAGAQHRRDVAVLHRVADAARERAAQRGLSTCSTSLGYSGSVTPQLFDLFWKVTANPTHGSRDPGRSALGNRRRCAW